MAACLGSSHGNCNFILLSSSTMFSFTNISNSSDLMVCFAMEAEVCLHWKIAIVARPLKVLKHRCNLLKGRLKYWKYLGCKSLRIQCQSEWPLSDFSKEQTWALDTGEVSIPLHPNYTVGYSQGLECGEGCAASPGALLESWLFRIFLLREISLLT